MVVLIILPLFIKLVELLCSWSTKAIKKIDRFKETNVYWNLYLRFLIEAYLELAIASLLRI